MVYSIDIDGTICTISDRYEDAEPFTERIKKVNEIYQMGNIIILHTGRHWNNLKLTLNQLE